MTQYELQATNRETFGTSNTKRQRKAGAIPGIVYGDNKSTAHISVEKNILNKHIKDKKFKSSVISLIIDGKKHEVIIQDFQMNIFKEEVEHIDFIRASKTKKVSVKIPLVLLNADKSVGVKKGGILSQNIKEVEISCLAKNIPDQIELDIASLGANKPVSLSEITLPKNVELKVPPTNKNNNPTVVFIKGIA